MSTLADLAGCGAGVCTVVNRQDTVVATVQADGSIALIDPRALRLLHTLPARSGPVSNGSHSHRTVARSSPGPRPAG